MAGAILELKSVYVEVVYKLKRCRQQAPKVDVLPHDFRPRECGQSDISTKNISTERAPAILNN
jgi:hypothetical protein